MPRNETQEFLGDFNPHTSGRERRKLTRTNVYKYVHFVSRAKEIVANPTDGPEYFSILYDHLSTCENAILIRSGIIFAAFYFRASYTNALHDRDGKIIGDGTDFCDCLELNCPGCHFPCVKCGSQKCSVDCRKNRKWTPDHIELEGTNHIVTLEKTLKSYQQQVANQLAARANQSTS